MTLNLSEKNLNLLIGNPRISLVEGLEIKVDNADIQDGFIRFFTTVNKNGGSESAGSRYRPNDGAVHPGSHA